MHLTRNVHVDHSEIRIIYRFWLYSSQYIGTGAFFWLEDNVLNAVFTICCVYNVKLIGFCFANYTYLAWVQ